MISGEPVRGTTAVFSGDSITAKGPTVVSLKGGSQVTLDRDSVASFRRVTDEVNVTLDRGNLSLYHPATGQGLKVQAGEISIEPAKGFKTSGEVAMANSQISVTAREGSMSLHGDGVTMVAQKGKTVRLASKPAHASAGSGTSAASAAAAAHGGSHAATIGGLAAGAAGAGVGASKASGGGSYSSSGSEHTPGWVDNNPTIGEKNPTAVEHVGENVPSQACEHAASPSVPAQACENR